MAVAKKRKLDPVENAAANKKSKLNESDFGLSFRKKLKNENAISALKIFVNANKEVDVVKQYINAGGSAKEVIAVLNQSDDKINFTDASIVFSALYCLIMESTSNLLLIQKNIEEACMQLLSTHQVLLQNMLNSSTSSTSHKKTILKLFTAMVKSSHGLAKKILTFFSINTKTLRLFTDLRSSSSSVKLRTCFIHYLMSFLVGNNDILISALLQKKGLLTSIIQDLMKDKPEIIILVLTTLHDKVVENFKITKTLKLHTFNTPVLRSILKLYDYKVSQHSKDKHQSEVENGDDTLHIREAAHCLLLRLCTSHKEGILFRERNLVAGKNSNQLILTLLECIEKPWMDDLKYNLVTEILKVCPEFTKIVFSFVKRDVHPSVSEYWIKLVTFINEVIERQELNLEFSEKHQIFDIITSITVPKIVRKMMHECKSEFIHFHPTVRFHIVSLICTILNKISNFLNQSVEKFHDDQKFFKSLHEQIDEFLNQNLIQSLNLLKALEIGVSIVNEDDPLIAETVQEINLPNIDNYHKLLVDVLLMYSKLSTMSFNQLHNNENVNLTIIETDDSELLFKLATLIFFVHNPKPGDIRFTFMMKKFIEFYINSEHFSKDNVVEYVLLNTGFFDGYEEEVLVWLYCIKQISVEHISVIVDVIVNTLSALAKRSNKFMKDVSSVMSNMNDDLDILNVEMLPEDYEKFLELNEEFDSILVSPVKLSPMVPAFLYTLKENENDDNLDAVRSFALTVLFHLLHTQCDASGLNTILDKYRNCAIPSSVIDYVKFWCSEDFADRDLFAYPLVSENVPGRSSSKHLLRKIFSEDELSTLIADSTETECVLQWNMCIFYTVHLINKELIREKEATFIISVFQNLAKKLSNENIEICLKMLITNYSFLKNFSVERKNLFLYIIIKIMLDFQQKNETKTKNYFKFLSLYRLRFVLSLVEKVKLQKNIELDCRNLALEDIVTFLMLPGKTVTYLLNMLSGLPINLMVNEKQKKLSEWSRIVACLLNDAAKNLGTPLENNNLMLLISKVPDILKLHILTDNLEESLINYLESFPHHLHHISDDFIKDLIVHHPSIDKLALFLLSYRSTHVHIFQYSLLKSENILNDVNLLFEISRKIESISSIDEQIMLVIYKTCLEDVLNLLNENHLWFENNIDLIIRILHRFLDIKTCSTLCTNIESFWTNLNINSTKYRILEVIFNKAEKIELLIRLLIIKLNQMLTTSESADSLCTVVCEKTKNLKELSFLLDQEYWKEFIKLCLKISLRTDNSILLRTLRMLCEKFLKTDEYADNSRTIFQMMISHSEFVNAMLSNKNIKCELIELFLILTEVNNTLMSSNHIPLLMGAYKATLSKSDQLILKLLQCYEENGIRFSDCRPYLFGEAAVTHHSVRSEISVSLKRQPHPNQVLDLLDLNVVKNTIRYFPLDRSLRPEKCVCMSDIEMYDTSFLLPLMSHLLAPESRVSVQKFTRSGGLSLILNALSSSAADVRLAAFNCLLRFQSHLWSRDKEIQIWEHCINALQNGLLSDDILSKNEHNVPPRLPCIVTTFLAHTCLIISEPLHPLYVPITNFLLAKPSFDVNIVPNFLQLYYSTDTKHREHQEWILKIIRDGMRYKADWIIARKCFLFKLLLQYQFSSISNQAVDILILDILVAALKIPECKLYVVTKYGFLSWLSQIARNMTEKHKHLLSSVVNILKSLTSSKNSSNVICVTLTLLRKSTLLNIDNVHLEELLYILSEMICACKITNLIQENDLKFIIEVSSRLLDENSRKKYENCIKYKSVLGISEISGNKASCCIVRVLRRYIEMN